MLKLFLFLAMFFGTAFCSEKVIVLYSKSNCFGCVETKRQLKELGIAWVEGSGDSTAGITLYPTLVILIDGKEIMRIVGNKSKDELERILN